MKGNLYCWWCNKMIQRGTKKCPRCGANINGKK